MKELSFLIWNFLSSYRIQGNNLLKRNCEKYILVIKKLSFFKASYYSITTIAKSKLTWLAKNISTDFYNEMCFSFNDLLLSRFSPISVISKIGKTNFGKFPSEQKAIKTSLYIIFLQNNNKHFLYTESKIKNNGKIEKKVFKFTYW